MLIWTGTQGKIKINSAMKPISEMRRALFAPFAPVTAAIVNRAEWVGYTLMTPDPREDRLLHNLPNAPSLEWLAPTGHVSRATFILADGRRLAADFSEDGTPAATDATRTSLPQKRTSWRK